MTSSVRLIQLARITRYSSQEMTLVGSVLSAMRSETRPGTGWCLWQPQGYKLPCPPTSPSPPRSASTRVKLQSQPVHLGTHPHHSAGIVSTTVLTSCSLPHAVHSRALSGEYGCRKDVTEKKNNNEMDLCDQTPNGLHWRGLPEGIAWRMERRLRYRGNR